VTENSLTNVDLKRLGTAVGDREAVLRPSYSASAGLGATKFVADAAGEVRSTPLDQLLDEPVDFIKIDVEGMEMVALKGAAGLVAAWRPALFVEVIDEKAGDFTAWVDANSYRFEALFPDKTHCNYLVVPSERPAGARQAGGSAQ
jgi:hypothetical protein